MNKREARIYVLKTAAAAILSEIENGSGWIFEDDGEERPEKDAKHIVAAIRTIAASLDRRGYRLEKTAARAKAKRGAT